MPDRYTRVLFVSAAWFNWLVGLPALLAMRPVASVLSLQLDTPTAVLFFQIAMGIVVLFGWAYYMIAVDPVRYRTHLVLGIAGKSFFVFVIYGHWLVGDIPWQLPSLVTVDLIYTVLFVLYFRRTAGETGIGQP